MELEENIGTLSTEYRTKYENILSNLELIEEDEIDPQPENVIKEDALVHRYFCKFLDSCATADLRYPLLRNIRLMLYISELFITIPLSITTVLTDMWQVEMPSMALGILHISVFTLVILLETIDMHIVKRHFETDMRLFRLMEEADTAHESHSATDEQNVNYCCCLCAIRRARRLRELQILLPQFCEDMNDEYLPKPYRVFLRKRFMHLINAEESNRNVVTSWIMDNCMLIFCSCGIEECFQKLKPKKKKEKITDGDELSMVCTLGSCLKAVATDGYKLIRLFLRRLAVVADDVALSVSPITSQTVTLKRLFELAGTALAIFVSFVTNCISIGETIHEMKRPTKYSVIGSAAIHLKQQSDKLALLGFKIAAFMQSAPLRARIASEMNLSAEEIISMTIWAEKMLETLRQRDLDECIRLGKLDD